ncbi:hypothetical protein JCM30566_11210 [Marinitoga arctica]
MEILLTFIGLLVVISIFFRFVGAIFIILFRYPILFIFAILGIYLLFRNFKFKYYTYRKTYGNYYENNRKQNNNYQNYYDLRQKYDYYRSLLNLPENFTKDELRKRFRELTKKYHPDKCIDDKNKCEEKFKKINEAYEFLLKYVK